MSYDLKLIPLNLFSEFSTFNIDLKISLYKCTASDWLIGELDELSEELDYVTETLLIYIKDVSEWLFFFTNMHFI